MFQAEVKLGGRGSLSDSLEGIFVLYEAVKLRTLFDGVGNAGASNNDVIVNEKNVEQHEDEHEHDCD